MYGEVSINFKMGFLLFGHDKSFRSDTHLQFRFFVE